MTTLDAESLQARLTELTAQHNVPGASLAVLNGDEILGERLWDNSKHPVSLNLAAKRL